MGRRNAKKCASAGRNVSFVRFSYKADPQKAMCTVPRSEEQHMKVGRPEIQKKKNWGKKHPPSITVVFSLILSLLQSDK